MEEFQRLRETAFWEFRQCTEWDDWFAAIAPYLTDPDARIRGSAVQRMLAAAWKEGEQGRYEWLFDRLSGATGQPGMTRAILEHLRWQWPPRGLDKPARDWLAALPLEWQNIARVVQMLNSVHDETHLGGLLDMLDDPSDHLRAAAAHCLGELDIPDDQMRHVIGQITHAELARPGVAGPFWSAIQFAPPSPDILEPRAWMLDLLERRRGDYPDLWWHNDIVFHLHEICSQHPADVMRMLANGWHDLAIMTATEEDRPIPGMEEPLMQLGRVPEMASAAQAHLAYMHGILHPDAPPDRISHFPDWQPDAALFLIGPADGPRLAAIHAPQPLSDARAWELADMLVPPETRGPRRRSYLDEAPLPSQVNFPVTDTETHRFGRGQAILMSGDRDAREWRCIRIWQVTWPPQSLLSFPLPPATPNA